MAGRIRLRGSALAWKRCSPGNDATVHGPVSIGSTDSIPCSKVARAQLVTHGVRALPSCRGESVRMGLPWPLDRAARATFRRAGDGARPKVLTRV